MAPEVLIFRSDCPYGFKSDVYSFGIVLFELFSGKLPYNGLCRDVIIYMVRSCPTADKHFLLIFHCSKVTSASIYNTSRPFFGIGRLNFQSVQDILIFDHVFLRSHCYHAEWMKRRLIVADDLIHSFAFFIRNDHHDAITEIQSPNFIYSLFVDWLSSLAGFVSSAITLEKFW